MKCLNIYAGFVYLRHHLYVFPVVHAASLGDLSVFNSNSCYGSCYPALQQSLLANPLFCWPWCQPPCWLPVGKQGIGWASATTNKPTTVLEHAGKAQGNHCRQTGWLVSSYSPSLLLFTRRRSHLSRNFTPYWQCGFCQLLLQQPLTGAHPSVSFLLPSLSLPAWF